MVREPMYGVRIENMKEIGLIIKCMVPGKLHGQMEECIKDNTKMIKSMVLEHFIGQMVENMQEIGKTENNTEEDSIIQPLEKRKQDNGYKVSE